jgi:hypothetical protein
VVVQGIGAAAPRGARQNVRGSVVFDEDLISKVLVRYPEALAPSELQSTRGRVRSSGKVGKAGFTGEPVRLA